MSKLQEILNEWDEEVRVRGNWTSGHSVGARLANAARELQQAQKTQEAEILRQQHVILSLNERHEQEQKITRIAQTEKAKAEAHVATLVQERDAMQQRAESTESDWQAADIENTRLNQIIAEKDAEIQRLSSELGKKRQDWIDMTKLATKQEAALTAKDQQIRDALDTAQKACQFDRDMAARFAEDRDALKQENRQLKAQVATLVQERDDAVEQEGSRILTRVVDTVGLGDECDVDSADPADYIIAAFRAWLLYREDLEAQIKQAEAALTAKDQQIAHLRTQVESLNWQSIETAPKDEDVLACAYHKAYGWLWSKATYHKFPALKKEEWIMRGGGIPTHWLRLPLYPKRAKVARLHGPGETT